jgi:hypothetical protein
MATTTNYSWSTPDNTGLVKDGAANIRTLGSSVDTTLFTALGGTYPGLRLVKKQTIGTGVSSVAVTGAFSATYEAYKIIVTGGVASTGSMIQFQLGATTSGYYNAGFYATYAGGSVLNTPTNNGSNWSHCGYGNTNSIYMGIELFNPFLAKNTQMTSSAAQSATGGIGLFNSGYLNDTTSYTGFTLIPAVGTLTGGTIYVYGYGAS